MSSVVTLGSLEKVDLRDAWPHEASHFTPWLARPENLTLLGDALGLTLELESVEEPVGSFSADIVAKDIATNSRVLIENQLEQTDHCHLGQILTYAAGLDAGTVIWIAREFREPHRAAIDYLNRISAVEHNFFAVQIELLRIGNSPFAPRFNIVAKPNDWSKRASAQASDNTALSGKQQHWIEYWSGLLTAASSEGTQIAAKTPPKEGWCRLRQLRSGDPSAAIWAHVGNSQIRCLIWLQGGLAKDMYEHLYSHREDIELKLGSPLVWDRLDGKISCIIALACDIKDIPQGRDQYSWFLRKLVELEFSSNMFINDFVGAA